jgi:hypothetical protein
MLYQECSAHSTGSVRSSSSPRRKRWVRSNLVRHTDRRQTAWWQQKPRRRGQLTVRNTCCSALTANQKQPTLNYRSRRHRSNVCTPSRQIVIPSLLQTDRDPAVIWCPCILPDFGRVANSSGVCSALGQLETKIDRLNICLKQPPKDLAAQAQRRSPGQKLGCRTVGVGFVGEWTCAMLD